MAYLRPGNVNDFIEQKLDEYLDVLGKELDADPLAFSGGIIFNVDDAIGGASTIPPHRCHIKVRLLCINVEITWQIEHNELFKIGNALH